MNTSSGAARIGRYDQASTIWADKMRVLGYYDGYLGFLSDWRATGRDAATVADIGAGTGAMAEAWVAVNGPPATLTLVDPSSGMLARAQTALERRGVAPLVLNRPLARDMLEPQDAVLAAHLIEHFDDPLATLRTLRGLLKESGYLWLVVSKPHWCSVIVWLKWRHRTYRTAEVTAMLADAGFSLVADYGFPSGPASRTSRGYLARAI